MLESTFELVINGVSYCRNLSRYLALNPIKLYGHRGSDFVARR